jgi:DNA-binding MarR family transcriptional regulator
VTHAGAPALPPATSARDLLACYGVEETAGVDLLHGVRRAAAAYDAVLGEALRREGLTPQRWAILLRLHFAEQRGCPDLRPTELSRAQQVSKNTISAHLNALEQDGLIVRALDPADGRQVAVRLTAAARVLIDGSAARHLRFLNTLVEGLEPDERRQLIALLDRLHASILRHAAGDGTGGEPLPAMNEGDTV